MMLLAKQSWRVFASAAALAVSIAAAQPVAAQDATPPATAPAPVPDLPQPQLPASALAAAHDVVVSSGMSRSFAPMVPDLMHQIVPLLTRTRPELTKDLSDVLKNLEPEFTKDGERMTDIAAQIYARRMSEDELKQTAAFFNSPIGKKYVDVQPAMLDELVVAMQSWTQELSNIMMTRVRQEMVKKGHNEM